MGDRIKAICHAKQMHRIQTMLLLVLLCLGGLQPVLALDLYQVTVPVADESPAELQRGLREALDVALVKISGRRDVLNQAPLQEELNRSPNLVQAYQYSRSDLDQLTLQVQFQNTPIEAMLSRYGVPVWGRNRPELVVWMAIDDGRDRFIAQPDVQSELNLLNQIADNRGIPLLLPLMDLEDRKAIRFNDVWGGFDDPIARASRRYGGNGILSVRLLRLKTDGWSARWTLQRGAKAQHWQSQSETLRQVLTAGFDQVADDLVARYAPVLVSTDEALQVEVVGIRGVADFSRVSEYLSTLDRVKQFRWRTIESDRALFDVDFQGDVSDFEQLVGLSNLLQRESDSGVGQPASVRWIRYRLRP